MERDHLQDNCIDEKVTLELHVKKQFEKPCLLMVCQAQDRDNLLARVDTLRKFDYMKSME
jgi:hypothetical protein